LYKMMKELRKDPANRNVRINNLSKKSSWQWYTQDGEWEAVNKETVLAQIVETKAMLLEGEADESTAAGARYSDWHDNLRDSQDENGKLWKDQMSSVLSALEETPK
jgi:hypothetical protein